jgi:arylsulfatase A-like enzyme
VYSADTIHAEAMHFIQQQDKSKPFFLYLPYTLPHAELSVPHDSVYFYYVTKFGEQPKAKPAALKEGDNFEPYPHAAFAAMVSRLDRFVGEIIALVEQKHLEKNTLVIFTSDNGPHKEDGGDPEFFNSNGQFKGIKRDLYEGGVRVPFIAWQKGVIKPGTSGQVGAFWDLFPTFLQITGVPFSQKVDGISLADALYKNKTFNHPYLYWELHESGGKQAIRLDNWKAIKLNVSTEDLPLELYNLADDPKEENNLAEKYPELIKQMNAIIKKAHVSNKSWPLLPSEK